MKNLINAVGRIFTNIKEAINENNRKTRIEVIRRSFYIEERSGSVFVVYNGVAVMSFGENDPASNIISQLEEIRKTAIKFEYGTKTIQE